MREVQKPFFSVSKSGQVFVRTHVLSSAGFLGFLGDVSGVLKFERKKWGFSLLLRCFLFPY
jgi:hypothetical protein